MVRNFDRVKQLVTVFRFPGGARLPTDDLLDATNEAFIRANAMGPGFRGAAIGQFRAALSRCVHHSCMDYGRRELRHDRHTAGSLDERYEGAEEAGPYDAVIGRHSLEREALAAESEADEDFRRESHDLVAWGIAQMENDNYRAVLEPTYLEGLSGDAIAERLDISPDNVYARRSRGVKQLEGILRDHRS
ncbi:MAG: RNA polymerase sigma factor [Thermoleophilaceae bacterium]